MIVPGDDRVTVRYADGTVEIMPAGAFRRRRATPEGFVVSDFSVTQAELHRLLRGDFRAPLTFERKPWIEHKDRALEKGDRYVLAYQRASAHAYEDGFVARTERTPVWWITVRRVVRNGADGEWLVFFDVTDNRDVDLWLSRSGDYQFSRRGAVDELPVAPSDEVRAKAIGERDHLARLKAHGEKLKAESRSRARRNAA